MLTRASALKPLFKCRTSEEKITVLTADDELKEITLQECGILFGMKSMAQGIFYNPKDQALVDAMRKKFSDQKCEHREALENTLNNPKNYFSIQYINKTCGYGLIANEDIPKDTIVGIYSSEIRFSPVGTVETSYEASVYDITALERVELMGAKYEIFYRALDYGDVTRLALHFQTKQELESLKLDNKIKKENVITQNISFKDTCYNGNPLIYLMADCHIKKGEFAGVNYGNGYWRGRGDPYVFVKENDDVRIAQYNKKLKEYKLSKEVILDMQKKRKSQSLSAEKKSASSKEFDQLQPPTKKQMTSHKQPQKSSSAVNSSTLFSASKLRTVVASSNDLIVKKNKKKAM